MNVAQCFLLRLAACVVALGSSVYAAVGGEIPDRFRIPIVVVKFFPTNGPNIDLRVTGDWGESLEFTRAKTERQTHGIMDVLQQGSRYRGYKDSNAVPCLHYEVIGQFEFLEALPTVPGSRNRAPMTDYAAMMKRIGVEDWVQKKGAKEIWIWAYHGGKVDLWESNMSSPYGDVSNSDRNERDLPVLARTYTVYHYNYQRGVSEGVENHMHQIEAVLNHLDGRDNTPEEQWPELLFWGRFVGSDRTHRIVRPGCGWAHYPPNGERDYDWANPRSVETDMDDWKPDGSGRKTPMNCERWGGKSLSWFTYWMQHLPGPGNGLKFDGKALVNWWVFIGDYDLARREGWRLAR